MWTRSLELECRMPWTCNCGNFNVVDGFACLRCGKTSEGIDPDAPVVTPEGKVIPPPSEHTMSVRKLALLTVCLLVVALGVGLFLLAPSADDEENAEASSTTTTAGAPEVTTTLPPVTLFPATFLNPCDGGDLTASSADVADLHAALLPPPAGVEGFPGDEIESIRRSTTWSSLARTTANGWRDHSDGKYVAIIIVDMVDSACMKQEMNRDDFLLDEDFSSSFEIPGVPNGAGFTDGFLYAAVVPKGRVLAIVYTASGGASSSTTADLAKQQYQRLP